MHCRSVIENWKMGSCLTMSYHIIHIHAFLDFSTKKIIFKENQYLTYFNLPIYQILKEMIKLKRQHKKIIDQPQKLKQRQEKKLLFFVFKGLR